MRISAVGTEEALLVRKYVLVRFASLEIAFPARRFVPCPISPPNRQSTPVDCVARLRLRLLLPLSLALVPQPHTAGLEITSVTAAADLPPSPLAR